MTNFTYNRNIPDAPNNPSVDQPNMRTNTNNTDDLINVDHVSFNLTDGGYHKVIHEITQGADPVAIASVNQVYSKNYTPDATGATADTQLFTRTGAGIISQLTGYSLGDLEDGWQWIGGVLLQWGRAGPTTVSSGSFADGNAEGSVTFKDRVAGAIPFPNNCFIVLTVPQYGGTVPMGAGSVGVSRASLTRLQFAYRFNSNSSQYNGFYWMAIGN